MTERYPFKKQGESERMNGEHEEALRNEIRQLLEQMEIKPKHVVEIRLEQFEQPVKYSLILPDKNMPEFKEIRRKLTKIVTAIEDRRFREYGVPRNWYSMEPYRQPNDDLLSQIDENIVEDLVRSVEIATIVTETIGYYSKINQIPPPRIRLVNPGFGDADSDDIIYGRVGKYERLDPDKGRYWRPWQPVLPYNEPGTIYLNVGELYVDINENADPILHIALHEWLHYLFDKLELEKDLCDLSPSVDDDHTKLFIRLERKLGFSPTSERY